MVWMKNLNMHFKKSFIKEQEEKHQNEKEFSKKGFINGFHSLYISLSPSLIPFYTPENQRITWTNVL